MCAVESHVARFVATASVGTRGRLTTEAQASTLHQQHVAVPYREEVELRVEWSDGCDTALSGVAVPDAGQGFT